MTIYTDNTLTSWYVDDDGEDEFVDDLGNDVIIANEVELTPPASFFGYPIMVLWQ